MLVLMGRTCTGKNAICEELKKNGFRQLITYTTRPIRKGETPDVTYHYVSEIDFLDKKESRFFAETAVYHTVSGDWWYGTAKEDILNAGDRTVCILTPNGYDSVRSNKVFGVHIKVSDETVKQRQKMRGDDENEAARRFNVDKRDFKNVRCDLEVNNDGYLDKVVNEILHAYLVSSCEDCLCYWRNDDDGIGCQGQEYVCHEFIKVKQ